MHIVTSLNKENELMDILIDFVTSLNSRFIRIKYFNMPIKKFL